MNINQAVLDSYNNAYEHGWHDKERSVAELICLMHSELSEALEEHRNGKLPTEVYYNEAKPDKPEGIPIELADCIIRIFDFCGKYGIDLEDAINEKMIYNKTRPYRHGNKVV
jgi:NTP pyrophosphatase (non-canonical NTP hydrolase)